MNQKLIEFNRARRRNDLPADLRTGDVVRVTRKITEGGKERLQVFEGMIIAQKGGQSASRTLTVRKVSLGIGVEIIFPLNSPHVEKIERVKRTSAGRSKLYYVRGKSAKVLSRKLKEVPVKSRENHAEKVSDHKETLDEKTTS
ncbi:MAG: 50S ribosomal protein L19 [Candidatus Moraniibacteriota bacterium]|nr:MAG: 50S ribosomal protein L19 [Candidatus Moranbacteria bacterium]